MSQLPAGDDALNEGEGEEAVSSVDLGASLDHLQERTVMEGRGG